jgi:DNA-directed RNA polymerase subunit RPC12/RpoP
MQLFVGDDPSKYAHLLSTAFYLKNHLSKSALEQHLKILKMTTPSLGKEYSSVHNFLKKYDHLPLSLQKIYVCQSCDANLLNGENGEPVENQPCGHKFLKVPFTFHIVIANFKDC